MIQPNALDNPNAGFAEGKCELKPYLRRTPRPNK